MRRRVLIVLLFAVIAGPLMAHPAVALDPVEAYVERLYEIVLGRDPDPEGFQQNVAFTRARGNVTDITRAFFMSPEFLTGWGADDYYFVEALYLVVLDRSPDPAGLEHNVNLIRTGQLTREQLIDGFLASPEFVSQDPFAQQPPTDGGPGVDPVQAYVERLYVLVLARDPDPAGLQDNVAFARAEGNVNGVTKAFFMSPEFLSGWGADDYYFVEALYLVALSRFPDAAGWEHNVNVLRTRQMTREQLVDGFLASPEFLSQDPFTQGTYVITGVSGDYNIVETITRDDTWTFDVPATSSYTMYIPPSDFPRILSESFTAPEGGFFFSVYTMATSPTTFVIYGALEILGVHGRIIGDGMVHPDLSFSGTWTCEYRYDWDPAPEYMSASFAGTPA